MVKCVNIKFSVSLITEQVYLFGLSVPLRAENSILPNLSKLKHISLSPFG